MVSATVTPPTPPSYAELDQRLRRLEQTVAELTHNAAEHSGRSKKDPKWYVNGAGRFAGNTAFEEIVRLGRAYRESLRPKDTKAKRKQPTSKVRASSAARKGARAHT